MAYIKNKKIIATILSILLITGVYFVFFKDRKIEIYRTNEQINLSATIFQNTSQDSDNDGLKDWEEVLWKTDPHNPDTDNDGILDGDEISTEDREKIIKDIIPKTLTDIIGQQILATALINKQSPQNINPEEMAVSVMNTLNAVAQKSPNNYGIDDIIISSSNDSQKTKEYGNKLGEIIKKYFDHIPKGELTILGKALSKQNESELKKLKELSMAYKNTAEEVLNIEAPSNLSKNHLDIINSFSQISEQLSQIQKSFTDPMMSLIAVKQYQVSSETAYQALNSINIYFSNNNIIFEEKESGNLFALYL